MPHWLSLVHQNAESHATDGEDGRAAPLDHVEPFTLNDPVSSVFLRP